MIRTADKSKLLFILCYKVYSKTQTDAVQSRVIFKIFYAEIPKIFRFLKYLESVPVKMRSQNYQMILFTRSS